MLEQGNRIFARNGGNVFEGPRINEYPNKPMPSSEGGAMFGVAAKSLGYHPFPVPFSAASAPYKNIYGVAMGACQECGFCTRTACEAVGATCARKRVRGFSRRSSATIRWRAR